MTKAELAQAAVDTMTKVVDHLLDCLNVNDITSIKAYANAEEVMRDLRIILRNDTFSAEQMRQNIKITENMIWGMQRGCAL